MFIINRGNRATVTLAANKTVVLDLMHHLVDVMCLWLHFVSIYSFMWKGYIRMWGAVYCPCLGLSSIGAKHGHLMAAFVSSYIFFLFCLLLVS